MAYVHKSQCAPRRQSRLPYPLELELEAAVNY